MRDFLEMIDWFPDWRNEEDYAYLLDTGPEQWAWEFLRRNPEYQCDFQSYLSVPEKYRDGCPRNDMTLERFVCNPPSNQGETLEKYIERTIKDCGDRGEVISWDIYISNKYGIDPRPFDPAINKPSIQFSRGVPAKEPPWVDVGEGANEDSDIHQGRVGLVFDLYLPLGKQLADAEKLLYESLNIINASEKSPEKKRKLRTDKYLDYIRILDARSNDVQFSDIAEILLPHLENCHPDYKANSRLKYSLRAAKKLCNQGYRYLSV